MYTRILVVGLVAMLAGSSNTAFAQRLNASAAISSQELLPSSTKAWFSVPDAKRLDAKFLETQIGKLTQNPELEPFIKSLRGQFQGWLDDKNMRLGLNVEDIQGVRSGEICIAGIVSNQGPAQPQGKVARDSHGLVLLVDVSENLDAANELLEKLSKDLVQRGATREEFSDSIDAKVAKWKFPQKGRLQKPRHAFHTITGGWLLSSDNEAIFRKIVRRLVNVDSMTKEQTLAAHPAFESVMKKVAVEKVKPEVYWFVNPFGYVQLAQAIARERQEFRQKNNDDWARILQKIGFDGFKGVGGYMAFASGEHELLHRTFVYKPVDETQDIKQKRVFGMLDFKNSRQSSLTPPSFISNKVSGFFCAAWDMQLALKNVGHAIDTFARKDGTFDDTLASLKMEMKVDVTKVVDNFDNEFFVISDNKMPVGQDSEQIVIAVRLRGNPEFVISNIQKSWPHQHNVIEHEGHKIVEIDDSIGGEDLGLEGWEDDPFRDPSEDALQEEVEEPQFSLFEKRYCCATPGYLFVSNDLEYIQKVLLNQTTAQLKDTSDYQRVAKALEDLTDETKISFRQFSRLHRVLRPNYELMRMGKMAASDTIFSRLINQAFENNDPDRVRAQQIDGSKLPADFDKQIGPYLGPSGWVMESVDDGWLFTGIILDRQQNSEQLVKKEEPSEVHK